MYDTIINFDNKAQKIIWDFELVGQFSDGFWANSHIPAYPWQVAISLVNSMNPGTSVPKYERRFGIYNDDLWKDVGFRSIAAIRLAIHFDVLAVPSFVTNLAARLIRVDFHEENKDYRNSQVMSIEEFKHSVNNVYPKNVVQMVLRDLKLCEGEGFKLADIVFALKQRELYEKKDFNRDLERISVIMKTYLEKDTSSLLK